jgi:Ca2+-binding RTX toxin-like protein
VTKTIYVRVRFRELLQSYPSDAGATLRINGVLFGPKYVAEISTQGGQAIPGYDYAVFGVAYATFDRPDDLFLRGTYQAEPSFFDNGVRQYDVWRTAEVAEDFQIPGEFALDRPAEPLPSFFGLMADGGGITGGQDRVSRDVVSVGGVATRPAVDALGSLLRAQVGDGMLALTGHFLGGGFKTAIENVATAKDALFDVANAASDLLIDGIVRFDPFDPAFASQFLRDSDDVLAGALDRHVQALSELTLFPADPLAEALLDETLANMRLIGQIAFSSAANAVDVDFTVRLGELGGIDGTVSADLIVDGMQASLIIGSAGDDFIFGGGGADTIFDGLGIDNIVAGDGDDLIYIAESDPLQNWVPNRADFVSGGAGIDTISWTTVQPMRVDLVAGTVRPIFPGAYVATIVGIENARGSGGADVFIGNSHRNIFTGGGGADELSGGGGDDELNGGSGVDRYFGGDGLDSISFHDPRATRGVSVDLRNRIVLDDGFGNQESLDSIEGIAGGTAFAELFRGDDSSNLLAAAVDDSVYGEGGDDFLRLGALVALIDGGAGNDSIVGWDDIILFPDTNGDGVAEELGRYVGVNVNLGWGMIVDDGFFGSTPLVGIENVAGTRWADVLVGDAGSNILTGHGGDDRLDGGGGIDILEGGEGDDIYRVDHPQDRVIELAGAGEDEIRSSFDIYFLPNHVERLTYVGMGSALFRGNALANVLTGGSQGDLLHLDDGGDDSAFGGGGNDGFFFGAAFDGHDHVDGGAGDDQLALQGQYDILTGATALVGVETLALLSGIFTAFGASGSDRFDYALRLHDDNIAAGQSLTINANGLLAGEDLTIDASAEQDGSLRIFGGAGAETLTGGQQSDGFFFGDARFSVATDRVNGTAGADDQLGLRGDYAGQLAFAADTMTNIDTIAVISATDTRFGAPGSAFSYNIKTHDANLAAGAQLSVNGGGLAANEVLTFDGSAETNGFFRLIGGAGADVLTGGAGNDVIFGGLGADLLAGGGGADSFIYTLAAQSTQAGQDTISGFAAGDRIDLAAIDAVAGGADDAFTFIGSAAFTAAGQIRLVQDGAAWRLEANVDADLGADLVIGISTTGGYVPGVADLVL